jgi:hypothetical protein
MLLSGSVVVLFVFGGGVVERRQGHRQQGIFHASASAADMQPPAEERKSDNWKNCRDCWPRQTFPTVAS